MIDGTTYYYIVDNQNNRYRVSIKVNEGLLPFVKVGDKIKVNYIELENVYEIIKVSI